MSISDISPISCAPIGASLGRSLASFLAALLALSPLACTPGYPTLGVSGSQTSFAHALLSEEQNRATTIERANLSSLAHFNFMRGEMALKSGNFSRALKYYKKAASIETRPAPTLRARLARIYIRLGRLEPALSEVSKASKQNDANTDIIRLKAGILATLGREDEAIDQYEQIIALSSGEDEEPYILIASLYAQKSDFKSAKAILRKLIDKKPKSFFGYYYMAKMAEAAGDVEEAETFYRRARGINPAARSIDLEIARMYGANRRYTKAIEICKSIIANNPNDIAARNLLGQLLLSQNKIDDALTELEAVGAMEADPSKTQFKIALIKLQQRDFEGATVQLNLILAKHPEDSAARYYLASAYASSDRVNDALSELQKIKPKEKYFIDAQTLGAFLLRKEKRFREAIDLLERVLKRSGDNTRLLSMLASLYSDTDNYPMAISISRKLIKLEPKEDRHYFMLGVSLDGNKQRPEAIEAMKKAVGLNPKNSDALNYLGYTYAEMGENLKEAESLVKRAIALDKNNGYFIDSLGWVYFMRKDYEPALETLKKAVSLVPEDSVILEHYAKALAKAGKREEAREVAKKALTNAPKSDDENVGKRLREFLAELDNEK